MWASDWGMGAPCRDCTFAESACATYYARHMDGTGTAKRRSLRPAIGLSILVAVLLGLWLLFRNPYDSGRLMNDLVRASALQPVLVGEDHVMDADDGNVPSVTTRRLQVSRTAGDAARDIVRACRRFGLSAPGAVELGGSPNLVCSGSWRNKSASVEVAPCEAGCTVVLTTSVI